MKAYKWTTDKMQAFHDGHQFKFGWNEEDGVKDGLVCRDGGFHITTDPEKMYSTNAAKFPPDGKMVCCCYEVYYRKKDVLGRQDCKLRVKAFKILKKGPLRKDPLGAISFGNTSYPNVSYPSTANNAGSTTCTWAYNAYLTTATA